MPVPKEEYIHKMADALISILERESNNEIWLWTPDTEEEACP